MSKAHNGVSALIDGLGGSTKVATALTTDGGYFSVDTVRAWKHRGSIPPMYWRRFIVAAARRNAVLTVDDILDAHQPIARDAAEGTLK